jgi:hypothetical protein
MRKNTVIILSLMGMFLIRNTSAQESSQNDSVKIRKHELSINVTPLIYLLNIETSRDDLYMSYKYRREKITLRAALSSISSDQPQGFYGFSQINLEDSTLTFQETMLNSNMGFLQLGVEKEKRGRLFNFYGGVDFIIGMGTDSYQSVLKEYRQTEDGHYSFSQMNIDFLSDQSITFLNMGISPFIGLDMNINELVSVGVLIPAYLYYSIPVSSDFAEMPESQLQYSENIRLVMTLKF